MNSPFFLPAEWYPQDAVMLTWPHKQTDWQPVLSHVEPVFIELCKAISKQEKLIIICHDLHLKKQLSSKLNRAGVVLTQIIFIIANTNDTWARDHGPLTLVNLADNYSGDHSGKNIHCLNYTFNGWGNKFNAQLDNAINSQLFTQLNLTAAQFSNINFVFEGGAIESDGQGHLLTTAQCLLNKNRNPTYNQKNIEHKLKQELHAEKVLWLTSGDLIGDDTDAHIDTLCRFAPNNTLVYVSCDDENDPHYQPLRAMAQEIKQFTTLTGQPFNLIALPLPSAKYNEAGDRLPATYANYLIINNAVLVPCYQDKHDQQALALIAQAHPEREIIAIDCLPIIEQFGSLHCLTMQLPKGVLARVC